MRLTEIFKWMTSSKNDVFLELSQVGPVSLLILWAFHSKSKQRVL